MAAARNPNAVDLPSRIHAAPHPEADAAREKMLNAHWHGKRIREYSQGEQDTILRLATWEQTDEGRKEIADAARAAGRFVAEPGYVPATATPRGPHIPQYGSNPIVQYGSERLLGRNPVDPLTAVKMRYEEANPDRIAHWSNPDILGLASAMEGIQSDRDLVYGKDGSPVRFREMVLTSMPREAVEDRREMERRAANDRLRTLSHQKRHEELVRREGGDIPSMVTNPRTGVEENVNFGVRSVAPLGA